MATASAAIALLGPSHAGLIRRASEPAGGRFLPVLPELSPLLPGGGLRRGGTVGVVASERSSAEGVSDAVGIIASERSSAEGSDHSRSGASGAAQGGPGAVISDAVGIAAGTSLMLALLAGPSRAGSWCAVVGMPALGVAAAAEIGVDLSRLALVPHPGPEWPAVVAALIDGVDIVVVAPPGPVAPSVIGRLAARARRRGSVLVPYGQCPAADVTLAATGGTWEGVGRGHGRLHRRLLTVVARGRGAAARPRQARIWLPGLSAVDGLIPPTLRPSLTVLPGLRPDRSPEGQWPRDNQWRPASFWREAG